MLLSVIVPIFNTENYLCECIDSILGQSFKDFELILVDDGSTDMSGKICDKYAERYDFVKVIHQANKGAAYARKAGFLASRGEYVSFIDSDDFIGREMYRAMTDLMLNTHSEVICCNMYEEADNIRMLQNHVPEGLYDKKRLEKEVYPYFIFDFEKNKPGIIPSLCNKLIKRELLSVVSESMNDALTFGEDAVWSFAAIAGAKRVYFTDKAFYHYRNKRGFTAKKYDKDAFKRLILLSEEMDRQLGEGSIHSKKQIYGYITNYIIEAVRGELLFNKELSVRKRFQSVKGKLDDERIQLSLRKSIPHIKNRRHRVKLYLAAEKILLPLMAAFYFNLLRKG